MNFKEKQICRLCLKITKDEFEIDEIIKHLLEILLLKLDLNITRDPIVCQDCMEIAKKCLKFKAIYNATEEIILSYSADKNEIKHDIKVIYEESKHVRTVFDEDFNICRFCMARLEINNFIPLDNLMNGNIFVLFTKYMVEMDFNTIKNPIVCSICKENLVGYFKFVLNCLDMEEKIKAYCKEKGTDNMGQIKLRNVLLFMVTEVLEYPDKCSQTCKIEQEHAGGVPQSYIGLIKQEEVDIKDEEMILNENPYRYASEANLYKLYTFLSEIKQRRILKNHRSTYKAALEPKHKQ